MINLAKNTSSNYSLNPVSIIESIQNIIAGNLSVLKNGVFFQ